MEARAVLSSDCCAEGLSRESLRLQTSADVCKRTGLDIVQPDLQIRCLVWSLADVSVSVHNPDHIWCAQLHEPWSSEYTG